LINSITILICTFNGKQKLHDTLAYIAALRIPQDIHGIELLLVDNNSQDGTASFAQERWIQLENPFPLQVIHEPNPGKSHALTRGYNAAKGDLIVLCDDDNWLQKDYLVHAKNLFDTRPEISLAGGCGNTALFQNDEKPEWFDTFSHYFVVGTHHPHSRILAKGDYSVYGAGSVLRKTVWNKIYNSGFRFQNSISAGKAMAEDVELSMAVAFAGYKLYFDEQLTFTHDLRWGRISFDNFLNQEKLNGKGNVYLVTYELIYNRVPCRFLLLRFIKDYIYHFNQINRDIKYIKKNLISEDKLKNQIKLTFMLSKRRNMFFMFPKLVFKVRYYKSWIQNLIVE
jgi:glycosyltransferase involved in cell wall biosynthesis